MQQEYGSVSQNSTQEEQMPMKIILLVIAGFLYLDGVAQAGDYSFTLINTNGSCGSR